jgi:hypothetical protein
MRAAGKTVTPEVVNRGMRDADGNIEERPIETVTVKANCKSYTVSIEGPFKSAPLLGLWNAF